MTISFDNWNFHEHVQNDFQGGDFVNAESTLELFFITLRTVANQVLLVKPPSVSQLDDNSESTYFYYLDLFMEGVRARP